MLSKSTQKGRWVLKIELQLCPALRSSELASAMRFQRMSAKRAAHAAFAHPVQGRLRAVIASSALSGSSICCVRSNDSEEPKLTDAATCTNVNFRDKQLLVSCGMMQVAYDQLLIHISNKR